MKVIGLSGGSGSGKGFVCSMLSSMGAYIIDSDSIAHDIIKKGKPAYNEIIGYFGKEITDENGEIVRRNLGEIVFNNPKKLWVLNSFTHKYIGLEVEKKIDEARSKEDKYKIIIFDAPQLLESNLARLCDEIWVVYADEKTRLERIIKRDNISLAQAKNRILSQKSWREYKSAADVIIDNSLDCMHVKKQLEKLLN